MRKILKFIFSPILGRPGLQKCFFYLTEFSLKAMGIGTGSDFKQSGEERVLQSFARLRPVGQNEAVIFDVGANEGGYALMAGKIFKSRGLKYKIFCFEPSLKTFEKLRVNTSAVSEITCFNLGLGDASAASILYSTPKASGLSSLYPRNPDAKAVLLPDQEQVKVETLDDFCVQNTIRKIDFLKMDVEGHELKVLEGGKRMLGEKAISRIQFEFGGANIDSRTFFKDFFILLGPGYRLFRILRKGLKSIEKYRETDEVFMTTNYLAVLK